MHPSDYLLEWIPKDGSTRLLGEIILCQCPKDLHYIAYHIKDVETPSENLGRLKTKVDTQKMTQKCSNGHPRPHLTAPTLVSGWIIVETDPKQFYAQIEAIYPGGIADTFKYFEQSAEPVSLQSTLEDVEAFRDRNLEDKHANEIMRQVCAKGCLRRIAWPIDNKCQVSRLNLPKKSMPIICLQACSLAISEAERLTAPSAS